MRITKNGKYVDGGAVSGRACAVDFLIIPAPENEQYLHIVVGFITGKPKNVNNLLLYVYIRTNGRVQ